MRWKRWAEVAKKKKKGKKTWKDASLVKKTPTCTSNRPDQMRLQGWRLILCRAPDIQMHYLGLEVFKECVASCTTWCHDARWDLRYDWLLHPHSLFLKEYEGPALPNLLRESTQTKSFFFNMAICSTKKKTRGYGKYAHEHSLTSNWFVIHMTANMYALTFAGTIKTGKKY